MTKPARVTFFFITSVLAVIAVVLYLACRDHSAYFHQRKGHLVAIEQRQYQEDRFFSRHTVSLKSSSGLRVESTLLVPRHESPSQRYPVVVVLAGLETGKHAVDYVRDIPDVIILAIDYPYILQELNTASQVAAEMLPLRKAALETVPSVMLAIDYLAGRPDVDIRRLVIVGLSLGSIFVPSVTVEDGRPEVAVMAFGGGDLREIIKQNLRHITGALPRDVISYVGGLLLRPIEPLRYVERISPIPLLMINGTHDDMIPRRCTGRLFSKANKPKKLVWLQSRHITPGDTELTEQIVDTLKQELSTFIHS